jgi:hypothetical protein
MVHIDKKLWLPDTFAKVVSLEDLLRQPQPNYKVLQGRESEAFRQTQVIPNEIVKVLARHDGFSLVQKSDKTLGWMEACSLQYTDLKTFPALEFKAVSPKEFFATYLGTPYYWGGLTNKGIDCSGFSQLYFLYVFKKIIPKNSRDQRKLISPKVRFELSDHDLVFCHPKSKPDFHHVAIFYAGKLWHSSRTGGVKAQDWEAFETGYGIEEMGSLAP